MAHHQVDAASVLEPMAVDKIPLLMLNFPAGLEALVERMRLAPVVVASLPSLVAEEPGTPPLGLAEPQELLEEAVGTPRRVLEEHQRLAAEVGLGNHHLLEEGVH